MEERQPKSSVPASRAKKPVKPTRPADRRRQRAEELLAAQRARLDQVEVEIESQLDEVARALADTMGSELHATREQLAAQSKALASQSNDLDQPWEEMAAREQKLVAQRDELSRQETQLAASQREAAERQQQYLAQQQQAAELARSGLEELTQRRAELDAAAAQLHQSQLAAARAREEQQLEAEQAERRRGRLADLERRLTQQEEELERGRERTKNQRRRIANELKAERAAQQLELDGLRHTIEQLQVSHQSAVAQSASQLQQQRQAVDDQLQRREQELAEQRIQLAAEREALRAGEQALQQQQSAFEAAQQEWDLQRQQLVAQRDTEVARLAGEVERSTAALTAALASADQATQQSTAAEQLVAELHATHDQLQRTSDDAQIAHELLKHDHADLQRSFGQLQADHERLQAEQAQLRLEHETLERRAAAEAEFRAVEAAAPPEWEAGRDALIQRLADAEHKLSLVDPQRMDDLQRRFELAVEDARNLKRRNSELEEQLLAVRSSGPRAESAAVPVESNWAAVKRQLLESLEAEGAPASSEKRLSIESTVQITDEIVGQKDREIAELKLLLAQQSSNLGTMAVGASAIADTLERDELIVQERERLRKLQEEWREKLRQAEIDVSVERARIARQRAEIEEKLASYASEQARQPAAGAAGGDNSSAASKKPVRGRWLSRLGLKDGGE